MTWTCSECRQDFQPNEKKYKFNLCHICYFNPAIAKLYRTGEKQPLPDSPPDLVEGAPVPGVIGIDDGLMLATQREMDDDTFQLKISEAIQDACVRDKKVISDAVKAMPPGRKPDITAIANDLFAIKALLRRFYVAKKLPIPPDLEETPPPNRHLLKSLYFGKNYGRNPCGEIPLDGGFQHRIMPPVQRRITPPVQLTTDELDRSVDTDIPVRVMNIVETYKLSADREVMLKQMAALPRDEQLYLCGYLRLPFPLPVAPLATGSNSPYPDHLQSPWRHGDGPKQVLSSKQLDSLLAVNADELCDGK